MQKPESWDNTAAATGESAKLPPGAYICKCTGVRLELTQSRKEQLVIAFDIVEGEFKGFMGEMFDKAVVGNPDAKWPMVGVYKQVTEGSSLPFFKGLITAFENSNPGYHWTWGEGCEQSLRGKLFGAVIGQEEFVAKDQTIKLASKCRFIRSVDQVRNGIDVPDIKRLKSKSDPAASFGKDVQNAAEEFSF